MQPAERMRWSWCALKGASTSCPSKYLLGSFHFSQSDDKNQPSEPATWWLVVGTHRQVVNVLIHGLSPLSQPFISKSLPPSRLFFSSTLDPPFLPIGGLAIGDERGTGPPALASSTCSIPSSRFCLMVFTLCGSSFLVISAAVAVAVVLTGVVAVDYKVWLNKIISAPQAPPSPSSPHC